MPQGGSSRLVGGVVIPKVCYSECSLLFSESGSAMTERDMNSSLRHLDSSGLLRLGACEHVGHFRSCGERLAMRHVIPHRAANCHRIGSRRAGSFGLARRVEEVLGLAGLHQVRNLDDLFLNRVLH